MSKTKMRSIMFSINEFMKKYGPSLSYELKYTRSKRLKIIATDLHELGFLTTSIARIKPKHIDALVEKWKQAGLSSGTIKNRMSDLRFVCTIARRSNVIKDNDYYGIENRRYIPTENKALFNVDFSVIDDQYLRTSLELQRHFGLRRETCLKINPMVADRGDHLWLKGSWTKGNVEGMIPIRTKEQRFWLDYAKKITNGVGALIPPNKTYKAQRNYYDDVTAKNGFKNLHRLRHAYAQIRFKELAGFDCPLLGGKSRKEMTDEEKKLDLYARTIISGELNHGRMKVLKQYCG